MSWRLASFRPTYQSVGSMRSIFTAAFIVNVVPNNKAVNIFFIISILFIIKYQSLLWSHLNLRTSILRDAGEVYLASLAHGCPWAIGDGDGLGGLVGVEYYHDVSP